MPAGSRSAAFAGSALRSEGQTPRARSGSFKNTDVYEYAGTALSTFGKSPLQRHSRTPCPLQRRSSLSAAGPTVRSFVHIESGAWSAGGAIELFPPDMRRRDCDNAQKPILDALQQAGAFVDDSQIVWLLTVKSTPVSGGKVIVQIRQMDDGLLPAEFIQPIPTEIKS